MGDIDRTGMCAVISFVVLMKRLKRMESEEECQGIKPKLFERSAAARIARVGIPSMLQQSMVSLSMMMMQGLVNSYGKFCGRIYRGNKIDTLAMLPNMNFPMRCPAIRLRISVQITGAVTAGIGKYVNGMIFL